MSSKVIVPVSDFAALITRLERVEEELTARKEREAKRYNHGPCLRCGYGPWESFRASAPKCCPRCHSAYWDVEPRHKGARTPDDAPNPKWTSGKPGPRARVAARATTTVVEAPTSAAPVRTPIILPPELRPPGEPLIPPPPLPDVVAARTVDNPMNVRPLSEQLADLRAKYPEPDVVVTRDKESADWLREKYGEPIVGVEHFEQHGEQLRAIVNSIEPTSHLAPLPDTVVERILATGESVTIDEIREAREDDNVPDDTAGQLQDSGDSRPDPPALAEKKAAFFAGYEVPEGEVDASETPFVSDVETPSLAPPPDDDPFWK